MPLSVFQDKYGRKIGENAYQTYANRAREMAIGNTMLDKSVNSFELEQFIKYAVSGVLPMSGRHLQHGDETQPDRRIEVFTNCSTAAFSFLSFYLLLNGSGVGRDYSTESCRVNWDFMPNVRLVLDGGSDDTGNVEKGAHPDFSSAMSEFIGGFDSKREAVHKYSSESEDVRWIEVRDCREGWAEVIATLETAAFHRNHKDSLFIFDFSKVRGQGQPIKGMQNRPAQGPLPLMRAVMKVCTIKGAGMKPWKQALFIDHYLAACVAMGDVRRAARMATKWWRDSDIIEFVDIKRGGFLYSANNSVLVDEEFWQQASKPRPSHGRRVFEAIAGAAYYDQTGEPGIINVSLINQNRDGFEDINATNYINSCCDIRLHHKTFSMIDNVLTILKNSKYPFITNPCGEIVLAKFGGYCVIGDIVLKNVKSIEDAKEVAAIAAKALVRTNLMPALYQAEVERTNRIGVGITGIFEYAWQQYKLSFYDLIEAYGYFFSDDYKDHSKPKPKSFTFWNDITELRNIVMAAATEYSIKCGKKIPHTFTTIKPSGTISKIMSCTEGAHLPPYPYYIRWVIVVKGTDRYNDYISRGYPMKDVSHQYTNCAVVGFPTKHPIADIIPADKLVTAYDVTTEDQYKWVMLLDRFWLGPENNQISYTLKYDQDAVSHEQYMEMLLEWQSKVKCCSVMPFTDGSAYAYLPEEKSDKETYDLLMSKITAVKQEEYDENTLMCPGGSCPIELNIN